ncbi:hypothetical protein GCM10027199_77970 [Amycolatopsis magusensis]
MRITGFKVAAVAFGLIVTMNTPAGAAPAAFPATIRLPDGFQAEGIATGPGPSPTSVPWRTVPSTAPTCAADAVKSSAQGREPRLWG